MRMLEHDSQRRSGGSVIWAWAGAIALACTLAGAAWADSPPTNSGNTGSTGNGGFSADDETVGTLPSHGAGNGLELYRWRTIARPSLSLEGRLSDIQAALLAVRGDGTAVVETLVASNNSVRVTLLGQVQIALDRAYVDSGDVRVELLTPRPFAGAPSQVTQGRSVLWHGPLSSGPLSLPAASIADGSAPLRAIAGPPSARTALEIRAGANLLVLSQIFSG